MEAKGYQFGTFKGVFTPSILTILGVIMYLRLGWVTGHLGLVLTLVTVTLATAITFLTGLSLSAIATNMKIGGGGAYFIISRSLGLEIGAAIGVPLFLAQSIGVAFYIAGFSEALVQSMGTLSLPAWLPYAAEPERAIAILTLIVLTLVALISAELALKTQLLILLVIVMSLVSFFAGTGAERFGLVPGREAVTYLPFWVVFAVFFPAVTGIEAGIAMSGDLKNPTKSLPWGTLAAVLVGYLVYMGIPVALTRLVPDRATLIANPMVMQSIARWGGLIIAGICAATLSSALGALLGAPRTLQALAKDRVLPGILARGYGKQQDPRAATTATFLVALAAVLLGDLNLLAPVLTMFFLTSYGLINLSAGLEGLIGSVTWRPQFRVAPWVSLVGSVSCLVVMLMINAGATLMAIVFCGGIYIWIKRRNLTAHWGDMRYGMLMLIARSSIRHLARRQSDARTWQPNILVMSGAPQNRWYLIELAGALVRGPGCLTVAAISPERGDAGTRSQLEQSIQAYLQKRQMDALVKVMEGEDVVEGMVALVKAYGFGPIVPNTVLMGTTRVESQYERFADLIRTTHRQKRNLILVSETEGTDTAAIEGPIIIWWRGQQGNIGLTVALAKLLTRHKRWGNVPIVMKRIVDEGDDATEVAKSLQDYIAAQRLGVDVEVVVRDPLEGSVLAQIQKASRGASLVLLGLRAPGAEETLSDYAGYYRALVGVVDDIPAALVLSADEADYQEIIGLS